MTRPLLEIRDLAVDIAAPEGGARILNGVSLSVGAGESVGIVGESGCGKSMTALAAMGLLPDNAQVRGTIHFADRDVVGLDDAEMSRLRGRQMAMIFQEPMTALNPVRTIGDQVGEGPRIHFSWGVGKARRAATDLLGRVGLPPARFSPDLYPHQLSGGQRQRVAIAMALACRPRLLIADEPTTALDVTIQAQILDLLVEVSEEAGMALLIISHDLGVVAETTDRMAVMYAGTVVEEGPTAQVFADMAHPYTRGLFAAMPSRALVGGEKLAAISGRVPDPRERVEGCPFAPRCPRARDRCRAEFPAAFSYGDPGHTVRCFYPGPGEDPA